MVHALLPVVWHQQSHKDQCWVQFYFLYIYILHNIQYLQSTKTFCPRLTSLSPHKLTRRSRDIPRWHIKVINMGQMKFNVKKCCILHISTLHSTSNYAYTMYRISLYTICQGTPLLYMGVLLNDKLSWIPHMHSICIKANHLLEFLYIVHLT